MGIRYSAGTGGRVVLSAIIVVLMTYAAADAAGRKTAIFPFEWVSSAGEEPRPDETARLKQAKSQLAKLLAASGAYEAIDVAPAAEAIAKSRKFQDCRQCAEEIARTLGADVAVTAWIQKASELILNITIVISDAKTSQILAAGTADIRGNNDVSWQRGVEWLVKHRLVR